MKPQRNPSLNYQRGAVLVVGLLLLMVMTVLGISSLKTVTLEERMSANAYDRSLAFQAAEAALRVGEDIALRQSQAIPQNPDFPNNGKPGSSPCQCLNGLCTKGCTLTEWNNIDFSGWATTSVLSDLSGSVKYMVEAIDNDSPCPNSPTESCSIYRITALSQAAPNRAKVVLQSLYLTRNPL